MTQSGSVGRVGVMAGHSPVGRVPGVLAADAGMGKALWGGLSFRGLQLSSAWEA